MAFPTTSWYVNSVAYAAVTAWATGATIAAGALRRQNTTPTVGNERVFVAIVGGTTHATTEPTWVVTRGAKTTDNTVTWQECTGQAAVNGDITNTPAWLAVKSTAVTLGAIIKDAAGTHLFIASTAGTAGSGSEPSWSTGTVGNTTADNTVTWTYIGLASSFGKAAAPHARIPNALASTWSLAGESIYVGDNSAEASSAATTIAGQSSPLSSPNYILCHSHTGNYPPQSGDLTTGATITQSGGANFQYTAANLYMRGIETIISANSIPVILGNSGGALQRFDTCLITFSGTAGASNSVSIGTSGALRGSKVIHDNCTITFNNASQNIQPNCAQWEWRNGAFAGTAPTTLINAGAGIDVWIHGVDLSLIGSTKKLAAMSSGTSGGLIVFDRCKLDNAVTVATVTSMTSAVILSKCDGGGVNYRDELYGAQGTATTETTIVRTSGQSDGTTSVSRKTVTGSGSLWMFPFECQPIAIWNETTGSSITVTLFGIWGGGAVPNNDDFWIDVEYLGSSASPVSSRATSTKSNILASNAALSTDASSWGGSTTPFKTSVTITPQMKGYIYVTPKMAKASTTLYYDTKLTVV